MSSCNSRDVPHILALGDICICARGVKGVITHIETIADGRLYRGIALSRKNFPAPWQSVNPKYLHSIFDDERNKPKNLKELATAS
jgi:hypothetical protein